MFCLVKSIMWYYVDFWNWKKLIEFLEVCIYYVLCVLNGKIYIIGEFFVINIYVLFFNMRKIFFDWFKYLYDLLKSI